MGTHIIASDILFNVVDHINVFRDSRVKCWTVNIVAVHAAMADNTNDRAIDNKVNKSKKRSY